MEKNCPKCESAKWMTGMKLTEPNAISAWVKPPTILESAKGVARVRMINVCADCGHVEFQAAVDPDMWELWRKQNG